MSAKLQCGYDIAHSSNIGETAQRGMNSRQYRLHNACVYSNESVHEIRNRERFGQQCILCRENCLCRDERWCASNEEQVVSSTLRLCHGTGCPGERSSEEGVASVLPVPSGSGAFVVKFPEGAHHRRDLQHHECRGGSSGGSHQISHPRPLEHVLNCQCTIDNVVFRGLRANACYASVVGRAVEHDINLEGLQGSYLRFLTQLICSTFDIARQKVLKRTLASPQIEGGCALSGHVMNVANVNAAMDNAIAIIEYCDRFSSRELIILVMIHTVRATCIVFLISMIMSFALVKLCVG